jgi:hypothetical protein
VTATYMGGRRGPPDGDERPLRGIPGGRARPRPSPPREPSDDDRPLRVVPGGPAPPLRVIPGGAGAPSELAEGDGHAGGALATVPAAPVAAGGRRRGAPRRRWVAAILALVVVAGLALTGLVVADPPRTSTAPRAPATTASPGSVAPVQPSPVVATIATGGFSYGMVAGAGGLWVAGSDEVTRIDPATDTVAARIPVATGSGPAAVAVGAGAVWAPMAVPGALWGIDPEHNKVVAKIPLGGPLAGSISVSATRDTVWVAAGAEVGTGAPASGGRLLRVDPRRRRVVADIALPAAPVAIAADSSAAWVATARGEVLMVSRKRNRVAARIEAGGPLGFGQTIAVGSSGVWLADPFDEQIVRIDPRTRRVMARIPAGAVTTLAVTGDAVWALSSLGLVRVDPAQDRVAAVESAPDLRRARLLAADADAVWTAAWSSVSRIDPALLTP